MSFIDKMRSNNNENDNPYYDEYKKYVNPYLEQYKSYVPPKATAKADANIKPYVPRNTTEYVKKYAKQNNLNLLDVLIAPLGASKIAMNANISGVKNGIETAKNTKPTATGKENVFGTTARVLTSVGEGFLRPAEGVGDLINLGIGEGQKALGFNEAAEASKRAALNYDTTEWLTQPAKDTYDPYAYNGFKSGQLGDQIGQGIGQVGFNIGAGKLLGANPTATGFKAGATRMAPIFTSSLGSGTVEALNKGNSMGKSLLYGAGKGAIEAGSEALFGGLGKFMGKGALDDVIVGNITKSIRTPLLKNLAALGIKAAGEGIEENISGLLTPILDRMLIDPNAKMYWQDENGKLTLSKVGMDFVVGMLTSLVSQSPSNIQNISVEKKNIKTLETIEKALQDTNLSQEQKQVLLDTKAKITEAMQGRNYTNEQLPQPIQTPQQTQVNSVTEQDIAVQNNVVAPSNVATQPIAVNTNLPVIEAINIASNKEVLDSTVKAYENKVLQTKDTQLKQIDTQEKQGVFKSLDEIKAKEAEINKTYEMSVKEINELAQQKENQLNTIAEEIQKDDDVLVIKGNLKEYLELKDQYEKNKDLSIRNKLVDRINALEDKLTQEEMQVVYKRESKQLNTKQDLNTIKPSDPTKATTYNTQQELNDIEIKKNRFAKVREYRERAKGYITNIKTWKDKSSGFKYARETMERNLTDIIPNKKEAKAIVDEYISPITQNNAKQERFINEYNKRIKALNLTNKESTAVQMLGEFKYNPDTTVLSRDVYGYIKDNNLDIKKLENAVETFRTIYDELIVTANQVLKENGYKEIPYRKGYFPHFTDEKATSILGKVAEKLGWSKKQRELPTSIAGMTDIFKPGKTWFGNALRRTGDKTDYNAVKGYDNYIRGITDQIFHTEDIQKLRALENEIRYQYSEKGIQEEIDLIRANEEISLEQQEELISNVFERTANQVPNLVIELRRYTDMIANKKDIGDRSMEQMFGRGVYTTAKNINGRLGANMVGLNLSSALTNFIPITQAYSQVSTKNMINATYDTMKAQVNDDGFADKSTFLTNRIRQADKLYKTGLEKTSDIASLVFFEIDNITANIVVRGKYIENIHKGMSEAEAMKNADQFAKDVIGGRDKGSMPTVFNKKNPFVKLVTTFQYEVNNQYSYMFKDLPRNMKEEGIARLVMAFIKMFMAAWLYNKGKEAITGTKSATSPIDIIEEAVKTIGNDNLSTTTKGKQIATSIVKEVPFIGGVLGGGRLPIQAALPSLSSFEYGSKAVTGDTEEVRKTAANNLLKELSKPVFYLVPPFGGGQAKKTIEGLSMFSADKKISGSYTASGDLRFPVEGTTGNKVQAALFGQYASKEAREYFDNERRQLSDNQLKELSTSSNIQKDYETLMNVRELNSLKTQRKKLIEEGKSTMEVDKKIAKIQGKIGE